MPADKHLQAQINISIILSVSAKPVQTCKRLLQVLTGKQERLNHYFPALSKPADTDLYTCAVGLVDSGYRRVNFQIFSSRS